LRKVIVVRDGKYRPRTTFCGIKPVQSESTIRNQLCYQGQQEQHRALEDLTRERV